MIVRRIRSIECLWRHVGALFSNDMAVDICRLEGASYGQVNLRSRAVGTIQICGP
jgi:hypothetical protein